MTKKTVTLSITAEFLKNVTPKTKKVPKNLDTLYNINKNSSRLNKKSFHQMVKTLFGREEATRTPDPYVPNVVRYQLRYFSIVNANLAKIFSIGQ